MMPLLDTKIQIMTNVVHGHRAIALLALLEDSGAQYAKTGFSPNIYEIKTIRSESTCPSGTCWRFSKEEISRTC